MIKICATISVFLTVFGLSAQLSVYEATDIESVAPDVRTLAQKITAKIETDRDKIALIYTWIAENIDYDGKALKDPRAYQSPSDVLNSGRAVCFGYAQLFKDMCAACGIVSYVVTGYGFDRGIPYKLPDEANHAWNSVFVDGQWELVDVTWGSGKGSADYLFTSPGKFGRSHIPSFYGWLLTPCTDSRYFEPDICGLSDSLSRFLSLSTPQRAIAEASADYSMNSSKRNRLLLGQAYINYAIVFKEIADSNRDSSSIPIYDQSLEVFEKGMSYVDSLFDWQHEALAFAILNRASLLYNTLSNVSYAIDTMEFIIQEFEKAIRILETIENSITAMLALEQSRLQLIELEEELDRIKK